MNASRGVAFAAVFAMAVLAGIIASSSGSAMAAPTPRSTVRREMCFLVINIPGILNSTSTQCDASAVFTSAGGAGVEIICFTNGSLFTMPVTMEENL